MRRSSLLLLTLLSAALAACSRGPRLVVYAPPGVLDAALAEEWTRATQWGLEIREAPPTQSTASRDGEPDCDLLLLPGDLIPRLIAAQELRPLDLARLPHSRELAPRFRTEPSDGANEHSIPVAFRLAGIAHGASDAGPATWAEALPAETGNGSPTVGLEHDPALVVGAALIATGRAPTSTDREDHRLAAARLRPLARRVAGYEGSVHVAEGDATFALCWSHAPAEGVAFRVPTDGTLLATVRAAIPATAPHADQAYAFIRFLLDPGRNALWTHRRGLGGVTAPGTPHLHEALSDRPVWWLVQVESALPLRERLWAALRAGQ